MKTGPQSEGWITREQFYERGELPIPEEPEVPDCVAHVEEWFWKLSRRRQQGFDSPNPLTPSDIQSWFSLRGEIVLPEEFRMIMAMDDAYLEARAKEREEMKDRQDGR